MRGLLISKTRIRNSDARGMNHSARAERIFPQTVFQILNKLRKPHRSREIRCFPRKSAAQIELPFELLSVAFLIHDGTLLVR
jgi:hypothetical protein